MIKQKLSLRSKRLTFARKYKSLYSKRLFVYVMMQKKNPTFLKIEIILSSPRYSTSDKSSAAIEFTGCDNRTLQFPIYTHLSLLTYAAFCTSILRCSHQNPCYQQIDTCNSILINKHFLSELTLGLVFHQQTKITNG